MIALKRIVLPTDFSENARQAGRYAVALAERFGAELHLLHVMQDLVAVAPEPGLMAPITSDAIVERTHAAEQLLAKLPEPDWGSPASVVRATRVGPPFLEIVRYARETDADLIVLGTHGRSGLAHILMGSVAERVVRKAPCPVLTVRPSGHQFVMP